MPTLHGIKALARTALPQPAFATLRALSRRIRELQTGPKIFADFRHFPKTAADADLGPYFDLLRGFDDTKPVALDRAHNMLIVSTILSMKPRNVVELGTGSGFFTSSIIYALEYNGTGQLTSVDNWRDTDGAEPDIVMKFRQAGVRCVHWGEEEFVHNAPDDSFDLLISDADHYNSHKWLDQYLRIVRTNGILFLHDTNNSLFPALANTAERVGRLGLPHYHFTANSRSTERCDRGLLYVINKKSQEAVHGGAAMSDVHNMSR